MKGTLGGKDWRRRLPSYIPSHLIARALIDLVSKGQLNPAATRSAEVNSQFETPPAANPVGSLRLAAERVKDDQIRGLLINAIDSDSVDLAQVEARIAASFDAMMDRVSGWYKRKTQLLTAIIALILALGLNVNAGLLFNTFLGDAEARDQVRSAVERFDGSIGSAVSNPEADSARETSSTSQEETPAFTQEEQRAIDEVRRLVDGGFPIGWSGETRQAMATIVPDGTQWKPVLNPIVLTLGYACTILAVLLGAPFWFDVLNRLMVIRATVKPTEKSKDEAPQDPSQPKNTVVVERKPATPAIVPEAASAVDPDIFTVGAHKIASENLLEDDEGEVLPKEPPPDSAVRSLLSGFIPQDKISIPPGNLSSIRVARGFGELGPKETLFCEELNKVLPSAEIDTHLRLAHFLSQIAHETGGFRSLVESTRYTKPADLDRIFKNVQGIDHATRLVKQGPVAIGNTIYANKNGNGSVASGDGYRFRGRGFLQITGRANYAAMATLTDLPLIAQPEMLERADIAAQTAAAYWKSRNINSAADADDVSEVTLRINGRARLHLEERKKWLRAAKKTWSAAVA